jgi:hypothetical protein
LFLLGTLPTTDTTVATATDTAAAASAAHVSQQQLLPPLMLLLLLLHAHDNNNTTEHEREQFVMALILIMHVMGCGLFIIPTIAKETYDFRAEEGLLEKSVGLQYMFGIYWAAMVSHHCIVLQVLALVLQVFALVLALVLNFLH